MHDCSFNFKEMGKDLIEKNNPKIIPIKLAKF
jgi:hypothetical protein